MTVLAAMLIGITADSAAEASCGDYVTVHGRADLMSHHAPRGEFDAEQNSNSQPGVPPCQGAACRGQFPVPATPPATPNVISNGPQDIAVLPSDAAATANRTAWSDKSLAVATCDGHQQRLRRPPRS